MNLIRTTKTSLSFIALAFVLLPLGAEASIGEFFYTNVVLGLFGTLLGWCALILNWSINTFVIGFGDQMRPGGPLNEVVTQSWETLRDLFNLTFIFGLVYIGFKMILRTDDGQTKRWLINIILAALLVNFSLFITKFVIDVSNITAVEIINLGDSSNIFTVEGNTVNLSGDMQNITRLSTAGNSEPAAGDTTGEGSFSVIFGTMFLFIITAFVYISAGILLIARGGILILMMIVSPFLFIGMVLPVFRNTSAKLWSTLFKRAFLAPIFLAILYISMSVAGAFTAQIGADGFKSALAGDDITADGGVAFGSYILIIILLLSSLTIAQKLGAEGATSVINAGQRMRRSAQKNLVSRPSRYIGRKTGAAAGAATAGVAGASLRRTVGRNAYNYVNSDAGKKAASGGALSRARVAMNKKISETSFDGRSKKGGVLGAGQTGGYATTAKTLDKQEKQRAKDLERNPYDAEGKPKADYKEKLDTDTERNAALVSIESAKTDKEAAEQALAASEQEMANALATSQTLQALQAKLSATNDLSERQSIKAEIAAEENNIKQTGAEKQQTYRQQITTADNTIKTANKAKKQREATLEGEYKYEFVNELKERRIQERDRWSKAGISSTAGITAGVGGAALAGGVVAGPIGALVGGLAAAAASAKSQNSEAQIAAITSEYGADGRKKIKNQRENDLLKGLKKQIDDLDSGENSTNTPKEANESEN